MNRKQLLFAIFLLAVLSPCPTVCPAAPACQPAASADSLLHVVHERDQSVRLLLMAIQRGVIAEGRIDLVDSMQRTAAEMHRIDAENQHTVDSLLCGGWPEGLSPESNKTIWLVIDHAALPYQERWLPLIEEQVAEERVAPADYATLFDRIRMNRGEPQRYGTQTRIFSNGDERRGWLYPVEDPAAVDSLRQSVGLLPLDDYLAIVSEETGIPIEREAPPSK